MAAEEWSDARKWIISTDVDLDGRRMEHSESLLDFVASLRDGVVLCSIANIIKPDSVQFTDRKILNVEKHEFLCRKNISAFGNACKDVFRMKVSEERYILKLQKLCEIVSLARARRCLINKLTWFDPGFH